MKKILLMTALVFSVICLGNLLPHAASAATCSFTGAISSSWGTSGNWSCGTVPTSTDDVLINSTSTVFTGPITTVNSILLNAGGTLVVDGSNLTLTSSSTNSGLIQVQNSGILVARATTTNVGTLATLSTNTIVEADTYLINNGTVLIGPSSNYYLNGLTNAGTVNASSSGILTMRGGPSVVTNLVGNLNIPRFMVENPSPMTLNLNGYVTTTNTFNLGTNPASSITVIGNNYTFDIQGNSFFSYSSASSSNLSLSFTGAATQNITVDNGAIQQPVTVNKSGGSLNVVSNAIFNKNVNIVAGSVNLSGTSLDFNGDLTNAGTIVTTVPQTINIYGTTTNSGTFTHTNNSTVLFQGDLVNGGTLNSGSSSVIFYKQWTTLGTVMSSGTYNFYGTSNQYLPANAVLGFLNVQKTSGTLFMLGDATIQIMFLTQGNFDPSDHTLSVKDSWNNGGGNMIAAGLSSVLFNGTGAQLIGAEPHFEFLYIDKTSGSIQLTGDIASRVLVMLGSVPLQAQSYTIDINGGATGGGRPMQAASPTLFNAQTGTVIYSNNVFETDIEPLNYYNLSLINTNKRNITASTTVTHAFTNATSSTLGVNARFNVPGTYANNHLVILAGGSIIHPATITFTDNLGATTPTSTVGSLMYLTLTDGNRNLSATTTETATATITNVSGDSEFVTLTETSPSSGIFRNTTAIFMSNNSTIFLNDGELQTPTSGIGTGSYGDNQDASDQQTVTIALNASAPSPSSSGGGGGGGSSASSGLAPLTTQFQSFTNANLLSNTSTVQGIPMHSLVKLPNDDNSTTQADSSVYYIGLDGKRHAFPNDRVYFSWYADFSQVQIVSADQLSQIPLGANVHYRPGSRMVKFTTDPKVYMVTKGGNLRWVKTETLAISYFGSSWNTQIDDLSDAFYTNYHFGTDISATSDLDLNATRNSVTNISTDLF